MQEAVPCTKQRSLTMAKVGEGERNVLTILWRIENFSFFRGEYHSNLIWSPAFYPSTLGNERTALILRFPNYEANYESLSFYTDCSFLVDCEFSLLDCDGQPIVTNQGIQTFYTDHAWELELGMTNCPTREELLVTKKTIFLPRDTLTVRCRVWKSEGNFPYAESVSGCSRIEFAEGSILRPIGRLSESLSSQSDTFSVYLQSIHEELCFDFKYSLIGDSIQNAELGIELSIDLMQRDYSVRLEVSVLDNRQEVIKIGEDEKPFSESETQQGWVVQKFRLRENLREKMSLLKSKEGLSLFFRLTTVCIDISEVNEKTNIGISNQEHNRERATPTFSDESCRISKRKVDITEHLKPRNDYLDILAENMFSLYQQQTFSDFELRCGDVSFPVHKNILCARSPVFRSMFSGKMVDSTYNSLDVPDVDAQALNRMLTFMYGGEVEPDLTVERASNLYYAAVKYQVDSLRCLCSSILESKISVSNVSDILTLADRYQDSDLTSLARNFILSHLDDVMHSDEWEKILKINPVLAGKSVHLLCKNRAPKEEEP